MITTFIDCPCGNTEGFELATNLAECTSCTNLVTLTDTPTYHKRDIIPLQEIAKQQALEDIHQAIHLELWLEEQSPIGIDWANCFDTNNIRVAV